MHDVRVQHSLVAFLVLYPGAITLCRTFYLARRSSIDDKNYPDLAFGYRLRVSARGHGLVVGRRRHQDGWMCHRIFAKVSGYLWDLSRLSLLEFSVVILRSSSRQSRKKEKCCKVADTIHDRRGLLKGKVRIVFAAGSLKVAVPVKAQSSPMSLRSDWISSGLALGLCSCHSWSVALTHTSHPLGFLPAPALHLHDLAVTVNNHCSKQTSTGCVCGCRIRKHPVVARQR